MKTQDHTRQISGDTMQVSQVLMTPQQAKVILESNRSNRRVRGTHVDRLARIIREGQWVMTHQGVAISKDNILLDGQHRLMAVVKAGVPVPILVARGCDAGSTIAMDNGVTRSISDLTGINPKTASVLRFLLEAAIGHRSVNPADISAINDTAIGEAAKTVNSLSGETCRGITTAPAKAALTIILSQSGGIGSAAWNYATEQYSAAMGLRFHEMTRYTQSYVRQIVAGDAGNNGGSLQKHRLARAFKAYSASNSALTKLVCTDAEVEEIYRMAGRLVLSFMGKQS